MSQEDIKHLISQYEIHLDTRRNKLTAITTIKEKLNTLYSDLSQFLINMEEFWPRGNYHLPGFNFTIIEDNGSNYFKILYQRTKGLDYWYNPIDVYIEIFLLDKYDSVECRIQFSPTKTSINKNILELKTYLIDVVVDIWNGLGLELGTDTRVELYPPEDVKKRQQIRNKAKKQQLTLYLGFFAFCLVFVLLLLILK